MIRTTVLVALCWLIAPCCAAADSTQDLKILIQFERKARREAVKLFSDAHKALDEKRYDNAVELHKSGVDAVQQADDAVEKMLKTLAPSLESDDYDTREAATLNLLKLSKGAIPKLEALAGMGQSETSVRLKNVIGRLKDADEDDDGRFRQWALGATASSEYTPTDWSAQQATGKPNTLKGGDAQTAWASKEVDSGDEWLELTYEKAVQPTMVRVYETFNPGAVKKVEAKDAGGKWQTIWEGKDTNTATPGKFSITAAADAPVTKDIRITLDSAAVQGWNEIDAVELIGELSEK